MYLPLRFFCFLPGGSVALWSSGEAVSGAVTCTLFVMTGRCSLFFPVSGAAPVGLTVLPLALSALFRKRLPVVAPHSLATSLTLSQTLCLASSLFTPSLNNIS